MRGEQSLSWRNYENSTLESWTKAQIRHHSPWAGEKTKIVSSQTVLKTKEPRSSAFGLFGVSPTEKTSPALLCFPGCLVFSFPSIRDNIHKWRSDPEKNQLITHNHESRKRRQVDCLTAANNSTALFRQNKAVLGFTSVDQQSAGTGTW